MVDEIIEPYRAMLIPEFAKLKEASMNAGALGCGISGSGPSVYALTKGFENAENVGLAMRKVMQKLGIDFEVHVSKINEEGIKKNGIYNQYTCIKNETAFVEESFARNVSKIN